MFTDSNGKVTMSLETPQGGGYTGQIAIQTDETTAYNASSMASYVNSGQNDVTITVPLKEALTSPTQILSTAGTDSQLIIEVIALMGFLAFLSVIAITYVRRNKSKEQRTKV